ncbi:MAG: YbaN family protein [Ramlibacter sp.]
MQPGSPEPLPQLTGAARYAMLALAGLFLLLGVVGLFLPVMPTVPFLLVAAWAAARCSPALHDWLHNHPRFGRQLCDWRDGGVVPRRAKWVATLMMSCSSVFMLVFVPQKWAVGIVIAIMAAVAVWLWRRPESCPPQG